MQDTRSVWRRKKLPAGYAIAKKAALFTLLTWSAVAVHAASGMPPKSPLPSTESISGHPILTTTADDAIEPGSSPVEPVRKNKRSDRNQEIYYKGKLEFTSETGWLPNNVPFVFDRMVGIPDRMTGLNYTLVPNMLSLRGHMNGIGGRWLFRGNWEMSFAGAYTMIPRGPETRYFAYIMGIRRNFIQHNWKVAPYFEGRAGMGDINAKEPYGVPYAQGQDYTFTVMLGSGARYNVSPRFAISAGVEYMHISNLYMSEPRYPNYGINVYGPTVGFTYALDRRRPEPRADSAAGSGNIRPSRR